MSRITYVNGAYVPHEEAVVHVEDRGFQLGDSVFEVIAVHKGFFVYGEAHFDRLDWSLGETRIGWPIPREDLKERIRETMRRNAMEAGTVYVQVTRGTAPRDEAFPAPPVGHTVVITVKPFEFPLPVEIVGEPCKVITVPDIRWMRNDIKSVNRLANCFAIQQAREADAYEAVMVDRDGLVTECTGASAWIVDADGVATTRPLGPPILAGTNRRHSLVLAEREAIVAAERAFTVDEMKGAREVFLTGTTPLVKPVGRVDETVIGDGRMGPVTRRLFDAHRRQVFAMTGDT